MIIGPPDAYLKPYPERLIDDTGDGFIYGGLGGSVYSFVRGCLKTPRGSRFAGGIQTMRLNAPRIGGRFAVWTGFFFTVDTVMVYLRNKEDGLNNIAAGITTGAFLKRRAGFWPASRYAAFGGVFFGLFEYAVLTAEKNAKNAVMDL